MADLKLNTQEQEEAQKQTTMEWAREKYNEQYDAWMPWIEDNFLKYFTKDNRTSYVARGKYIYIIHRPYSLHTIHIILNHHHITNLPPTPKQTV